MTPGKSASLLKKRWLRTLNGPAARRKIVLRRAENSETSAKTREALLAAHAHIRQEKRRERQARDGCRQQQQPGHSARRGQPILLVLPRRPPRGKAT